MKRKGLLMVVALMAVACLMAAAAYTSATVTNAAALTVTNTNASLVALTADHITDGDVGFKDATAVVASDVLGFNFNMGRDADDPLDGDDEYGLQKESVYTWWDDTNAYGLFQVTNNSNDTVQLTITENCVDDPNIEFDFVMGINRGGVGDYDSDWTNTALVVNNTYAATFNAAEGAKLAPGETAEIGVRINITDLATVQANTFDIDVTATAVTPAV